MRGAAVVLAVVVVAVGCTAADAPLVPAPIAPTASAKEDTAMSVPEDRFVGTWLLAGPDACEPTAPARLRFDPGGLYSGESEPPGSFTWWDSGTWRLGEAGELALSTANDAVVTYRYRLAGDTLTITVRDDCNLTYHRQR